MADKARLYYEMHITVKAVGEWDAFAGAVTHAKWKASKFDVDDVDAMHGQWFLSARWPTMEGCKKRMKAALDALRARGYEILRWKIEDTMLDSKHGDTEEMLRA